MAEFKFTDRPGVHRVWADVDLDLVLAAVFGSSWGAMAYTMHAEALGRRSRLKLYLGICMVFAPCTGMSSMLCFALSNPLYLELPWVQKFTGVSLQDEIMQLASENLGLEGGVGSFDGSDVGGLSETRAAAESARAQLGLDQNITEAAAVNVLLEELPTAGERMDAIID